MIESGWIIAGFAGGAFVLSLIMQWIYYDRRLTTAKLEAENSLRAAAEAENEAKEATNKVDTLRYECADARDRLRREFGETVEAVRKGQELFAIWARDEFVRKASFEQAVTRMERGQEQRDEKLDRRLERMEKMISEAPQQAAEAAVNAINAGRAT